ncbi:hypothetical protein IJO12_07010 [bacterium]|nr:hypothetical protein [bacterium]
MNIFKTFEIFLKEPISILKENFIQIVSVNTENIFENKPSCDASITKDGAQITVVNNDKLYNLLSMVMYKSKQKQKLTQDKEQEVS